MSRIVRPRAPRGGPPAHVPAHQAFRGRAPAVDARASVVGDADAGAPADGGRTALLDNRGARGWYRRVALPALESLGGGISVAHAPPAFVHIAGVPFATSALIDALGALSDATHVQATPL